jgi:hypothetical protein
MSEIKTINQLALLIRNQVGALHPAAPPNKSKKISPRKTDTTPATKKKENLYDQLAQRLISITNEDPQKSQKAFRLFLEVLLLNELGEHLINDPRFYLMIDSVEQHMQSDPELASLIHNTMLTILPKPT